MQRLKGIVRIIFLTMAIVLAAAGVGIFGAIIPVYRERFMNNEIRMEMVDKKRAKGTKHESLKTKD